MTYTQVWDAMRNQVHDQMIQRDEDGAFIPFDEDNVDYVEYLWWLYDGNQPTPYTPPDAAPSQPLPPLNILGST
jgi:hypothetical protein